MIFKSIKEIPIGTILKKGVMNFQGNIRDFDGNLIGEGNIVVLIKREATKKEFLEQFKDLNKRIFESTLEDIDEVKFYEILTD